MTFFIQFLKQTKMLTVSEERDDRFLFVDDVSLIFFCGVTSIEF